VRCVADSQSRTAPPWKKEETSFHTLPGHSPSSVYGLMANARSSQKSFVTLVASAQKAAHRRLVAGCTQCGTYLGSDAAYSFSEYPPALDMKVEASTFSQNAST